MLLHSASGIHPEAGVDEAGRGALAGPVVAAAVILPPDFSNAEINDSKQLTEANRYKLRALITEHALAWNVGIVSNQEIDRVNILKASHMAMCEAIEGLTVKPKHLAIDGNRFVPHNLPYTCLIKGDSRFLHIAAASILAKTFRDDIMVALHNEFPMYDWNRNKGYPTPPHRKAIAKFGVTSWHRLSFRLLPEPTLF